MNATTQTAETYYVTQVRRPGSETWAKLHVERTALAAAMALTDALTTHGMHHSDIHGLREDLVAGHILTADDGYAFRIELRETAPEPTAAEALTATSVESKPGRTTAEVEHGNMLRAQRDLIHGEILRRMGGTR